MTNNFDRTRERTTAASRPTVCSTVKSDVLHVGRIHAANEPWAYASLGENPLCNVRYYHGAVPDNTPFSFVLGAKSIGHRDRHTENIKKEPRPIAAESVS